MTDDFKNVFFYIKTALSSYSDLVSHGFSDATAKVVIKELEEEGYIVVSRTYVSGNVVFELV